ncbi:hypothetical protein [Dialister sp.]|uniref:hypothetical protein n=1 Tax=Dialister sp. TaxID=1955814 RepID=UPI00257A587B|nr:hypothetical protein [Dialister sp.]
MTTYHFKGKKIAENMQKADFSIIDFENGKFTVKGNRAAAVAAFQQIRRMPPNECGNFYGREKAGAAACRELIKNGVPGYVVERKTSCKMIISDL